MESSVTGNLPVQLQFIQFLILNMAFDVPLSPDFVK